MDTPAINTTSPPILLMILGGLVATILLTALMYLAPLVGLPLIDLPLLTGGVFADDPATAFRIGYWVFFFGANVLVFAPLLKFAWRALPGDRRSFRGALVKGSLWGLILSVGSGLLLPALGAFGRLGDEAPPDPGFFGLGLGILGGVELLVGHLLYGLTVALFAAMPHGLAPFDLLGWMWTSHGTGESP